MNDEYYQITQSLNLYFLSYDYYDKPTQKIFNDWARDTKMEVPPELIADVYDFITLFKTVHISSVLAAAEANDNIIPDIFSQKYNLKCEGDIAEDKQIGGGKGNEKA